MRLKLMSGDILNITDEEVKNIKSKSGLVFVPSLNGFINLSSVESILPEGTIKKDLYAINEGYLRDGTKIVKKFGTWYLASNPDCRIDPQYYPEVARDEVLSENPISNKLLN